MRAADARQLAWAARSFGRLSLMAKDAARAGHRDLARYFGVQARCEYASLQILLGGAAR